ncbi:ceramide glucosyltransferase-like isoform X2 [Littorina saxatilis]
MMDLVDQEAMSYVVLALGVLVLMLYVLSFGLVIISCVWGWMYFHKKSDTALLGDDVPGVSIVKPLMGIDPLLEVNLESHFTLKYPKYELLICFHDDQDPAITLVQKLKKKYPKVDVKMFFHGREEIMNPMVQNMVQGYEAAQYEYVWISTSRIKVSTEIIQDIVVKLQQPNVALVHQMPFSVQANNLASSIEKIYFGCALARYYIAFNILGMCCVTGMSYIFKKSVLDSLDGLGWFGRYLAEDFFLTKAIHDRGFKLVLSAYPAQQNVSSTSVKSFVDRMVRWLRLRLNMLTVVASFLEPLTECMTLGAAMAATLYHFFDINPFIFFCSHLLVWLVIDYIQLRNVQNGPVPIGKLRFAWIWMFRECMSVWIFICAVVNPHRIKWGRRTYYVHTGGHTELDTKASACSDL